MGYRNMIKTVNGQITPAQQESYVISRYISSESRQKAQNRKKQMGKNVIGISGRKKEEKRRRKVGGKRLLLCRQ